MRAQRETLNRQILKNLAQVVVVVDASRQLEELLKQPAVAGDADEVGLRARNTHEHYVVRCEEAAAVLIAARKDVTTGIEMLMHQVHDDHAFHIKGRRKMVRLRILVGMIHFEQNIGHLGTDIVVGGVHGHHRTMKREIERDN
jgi:hypothetical protein